MLNWFGRGHKTSSQWSEQRIVFPLRSRLNLVGTMTLLLHPFFWYVFTVLIPQPFECLPARLFLSSMGLVLLLPDLKISKSQSVAKFVVPLIVWISQPLFSAWMYFSNGGNTTWLVMLLTSITTYCLLNTVTRSAIGVLLAFVGGYGLYIATQLIVDLPQFAWTFESLVLVAYFVAVIHILSAISELNRASQLESTLTTLGIVAHELRTPLSALRILGEVIAHEADNMPGGDESGEIRPRLIQFSDTISRVISKMNHLIDSQIINSSILTVAQQDQAVDVGVAVQDVVSGYPFNTARDSKAVVVEVDQDFSFLGSKSLFEQVIENLLKNALKALQSNDALASPGDITIRITQQNGRGQLYFADRGCGIAEAHQTRIFDPFFSTNAKTGHGLGLAFCKRVVTLASGSISLHRSDASGTVFLIEIPVLGTVTGGLGSSATVA